MSNVDPGPAIINIPNNNTIPPYPYTNFYYSSAPWDGMQNYPASYYPRHDFINKGFIPDYQYGYGWPNFDPNLYGMNRNSTVWVPPRDGMIHY